MEPSIDQLNAILDGLEQSYVRESAREFLRVWIRDWTMHKVALAQQEQEPVAKVRVFATGGNAAGAWKAVPVNDYESLPPMRDGELLYTHPPRRETEQELCTLAKYTGDGVQRQWVTVGAWLTPGERIVHLGPAPRD